MKNRIFLTALASLALTCPPAAASRAEISIEPAKAPSGVHVETSFQGRPDGAGILKQYTIRLPHFEVATYFAAFQKHDLMRQKDHDWPDRSNRMQPLAVRDFRNLKEGGQFLLAKLEGGGYLALLPLTGPSTVAWFASSDSDLVLNAGTLGTMPLQGDFPVLAWARGADPYEAARTVWELALRHPSIAGSARMRAEKQYPDILHYLGWCSWEEYKTSISEKLLLGAIDTIEASKLPIRWLLVDDGHLSSDNRQLTAFEPNEKFPRGWASVLARRNPDRIRWMGLWLCFDGYWNGISPKNKLGLDENLARVTGYALPENTSALEPKPGLEHSFAFYNAMIGANRRAGFDFVKVDVQSRNLAFYRGSGQPVESAAANAKSLEMAAAFHMDGLINCMAHGPVNIFNTRISAITRCSEDYKLGDLQRAKRHLHNSYANLIWLGQTVWGDHDMFHSDDRVAGRMMAVSKALSGGPVYLSDNPAKFAVENIRPLTFNDGRLLPVLAPGTLLPESLFVDPYEEHKPLRAVAPLPNEAAAIAVYNLTEPEAEVTGYVTPEDYRDANGLMQPRKAPWSVPSEGLILYDWYEKTAMPLTKRHSFVIPKFSDRLFLVCPVRNGWAVIGRTDKYLAPAAVEVVKAERTELLVRLKEPGLLTLWENGAATPKSSQCQFRKIAAHLWQADVASGGVLRITR
jgi:hypothetical protein